MLGHSTHLGRHIISEELSRVRASGHYSLYVSVAAVVVFLGFLGTVGLEDWLSLASTPKPLGRASILIVAGLLGIGGLVR
jgi:hypothetical protein